MPMMLGYDRPEIIPWSSGMGSVRFMTGACLNDMFLARSRHARNSTQTMVDTRIMKSPHIRGTLLSMNASTNHGLVKS